MMFKFLLTAGTMLVAAPVLAQSRPTPPKAGANPTMTTQTPPVAADPVDTTVDGATTPAAPTPQQPSTTTDTAGAQTTVAQTTGAQTTGAQTTGAQTTGQPAPATVGQPATTGTAVADVVDSQFPTYDKDNDGKLNRAEFSAWMVALKARSDPKANAASPATKAWIAGAWATADKDKSASVTKAELTGFLSQGKS